MLEVHELTKRFGGVHALVDVSFTAAAGAVTALVGPNGAGKTTLLTVVGGQMQPTSGWVALDGHRLSGLPPHRVARRGVTRTFQHSRLVPSLSVHDNVLVGAIHRDQGASLSLRRRTRRATAAAAAALELTGLSPLAGRSIGSLSYGQMRLVELARSLAREPRALLLDEPAAGLNPQETHALGRLVEKVTAEQGLVTLLVEHDLALVRRISAAMVVLNFGQVIASGEPEAVCAEPAVIAAYIGEDVA